MRPLGGPVVTAAAMRAAEGASGIPLVQLMHRAGEALAEAAIRFGCGREVLVLCGPGNNGGDGYVAARLLQERGIRVRVAASADPATDLAKAEHSKWTGPIVPLHEAHGGAVVIDALFGTGMSRPLQVHVRTALHRCCTLADFVIAADLPSGIDSDTGADLGAARADLTIAFAAAKPAHLLQPGAGRCGRVLIADIGISAKSRLDVLGHPRLRAPGAAAHKYSRGMVAVVAGDMRGAATLAVGAAARIAGYTVLCGEAASPAAVVRRSLGETLRDPRLGAVLIGPGLGDSADEQAQLAAVLATNAPLVLDGGALAAAVAHGPRYDPTILTPHEGEFARVFSALEGSKADRARAAAAASGATIVLKGSDTVVASPDGLVTLAPVASPWLSTAGTGDVLAGITVALLGRGYNAHAAACTAVWLHSEAARIAGPALTADTLIEAIPAAMANALG